MTFIQSFKDSFNKANIDFDAPDIQFLDFHPHLPLFLAINGIFFNNRESWLRFVWPFLCASLSLMSAGLLVVMIGHCLAIRDFSSATESFTYAVVLFVVFLLTPSTMRGRETFFTIVEEMSEHFRTVGSMKTNIRKTFLKGQLFIWQLGFMWMVFVTVALFTYAGSTAIAVLFYSMTSHDEHSHRPLMFPLWLPYDDPYRTPNYEIFLLLQYIMCIITYTTFGLYVYISLHILLHNLGQLDLVIISIGELFEGLDDEVAYLPPHDEVRREVQNILNERMGIIVNWHSAVLVSIDKFLNIYGATMAYQVLFSSIALCLMAYQVADQLGKGKLDFLFVLLFCGCLIQLFIPCYIGTKLLDKGLEVSNACYNGGWQTTPLALLVRHDLTVVMMQAQRPISLRVTAMPDLSLETFSSILSTAYSYFNMLRTVNEDV